ncbi:carbohydrate ABC transporter membrane protein 1 (CUT1 family) [Alicyclobacillus sacchari]|uniref:Carbohydrate ABC transporter membrane protein 1 (CUT1 family) n=1 Tax=Alicyclobacillus sacchari TaxID=392010 RepID=A0A4R8LRI9_9BACL|nr:sugar ABC transporter permease [Alicyclobacillus sacchari]TDY50210.1 carbohydrate ABC transporter membrane protein 1 (CUT1 family) [Alicyclobacillus sacchari]
MDSSLGKRLSPWSFLLPFLLLFTAFLIVPLLYAFYTSLFIHRMGIAYFVGFQNYLNAFRDVAFWGSIVNVMKYAVIQGVIMLALSLALALLLDTKFARFKAFFRLVYFLPYAVPGVFASIMWGFLYSKPLDPLLQAIHFDPLASGAFLYSIVNIATWEWAGYNMTLYMASLTGVSADIYEAAKMDGCNEMQLAWYIKIPLLRPTIVMTIILSFIGSMQLFNEPFLLEALTPVSQTFAPNLDIYNMAFSLTNLPYAATLSVLLGLITILISVIVMVLTRFLGRTAERRQTTAMAAGV